MKAQNTTKTQSNSKSQNISKTQNIAKTQTIDTIHQTCLNMFLWYVLIPFYKNVETCLEFLIQIDVIYLQHFNFLLN